MIEEILISKGIKPTANRILVARALDDAQVPCSLSDLETRLPSLDKSSIFRVLLLFENHDVVHTFEDGRGIVNYELCHLGADCDHHDQHIHFFCTKCHRSYCLDNVDIDSLHVPDGFKTQSISFVVKGICKDCS